MSYYMIVAAYINPGEGPVEPFYWHGEAPTPEAAVRLTQQNCRDLMEAEDPDDLLVVVDIQEVHLADVVKIEQGYVRMRQVAIP